MELFKAENIIGVFRGFREGGLEFHADLVLPYKTEFQSIPMHGQFLLVQLETEDEAVLGRIASLSSDGKLSRGMGEEFNIRAIKEGRAVPEDLRQDYLRYSVNIRVLGVLRNGRDKPTFLASHRRLPHVGSPVAFPSAEVLREIAGHNVEGADIGHFALGEYLYAVGSQYTEIQDGMQIKEPEIKVHFSIKNLVARRSFIFARAGFGKSNLNKLLFSELYRNTPMVQKRKGEKPVGTILFDPDGEYFWPDDKGRPGLCDVEHLQDKLVVFTSRKAPSSFYQSFVASGIKLDIRTLRPADVVALTMPIEKQENQNVIKLKSLSQDKWTQLVNLIDEKRYQAPLQEIGNLIGLEKVERQEAEALGARSNINTIVNLLHDKSSRLMDMLIYSLSQGKLCVVDVSQLRGSQALVLSSLILRKIFDRNQEEFTKAEPETIPTIAVVEEAQSVLREDSSASEPYIAWVKEGRKYDLGAVLITQQPGSIPNEILSQGDNWFIFHLLSAMDLGKVKQANAHFSDDLLSVLLNEPIPGQGIFWSSVGGKPYPISFRALSFEKMHKTRDPHYREEGVETFAATLKEEFKMVSETGEEVVDVLSALEQKAIQALKANDTIMKKLSTESGYAWGSLQGFLMNYVPDTVQDKNQFVYHLVPKVLNNIFGPQDKYWCAFKHQGKMYVKLLAGQIIKQNEEQKELF
jgi:uncharacterized protein